LSRGAVLFSALHAYSFGATSSGGASSSWQLLACQLFICMPASFWMQKIQGFQDASSPGCVCPVSCKSVNIAASVLLGGSKHFYVLQFLQGFTSFYP